MNDKFDDFEVEEIGEDELEGIKEKIVHSPDEIKLKFYTDFRDKLRKKLKKYVGDKRAKGFEYIFALPDFFFLLTRLLFDDRVKKTYKYFIGSLITYVILPIDIIPDFIPVIGYIDDMAVVVFGLDYLINHIDKQIILDNWSGDGDVLMLVKNIITKISEFLNNNFIGKIKMIMEIFKKNEKK